MPSITTTAKLIGTGGLIQNLGPDEVYIGEAGVDATHGVKLALGDAVAVGQGLEYYAISAGTSDVRLLGRATGFFPAPLAPAE